MCTCQLGGFTSTPGARQQPTEPTTSAVPSTNVTVDVPAPTLNGDKQADIGAGDDPFMAKI
jgi:hypothetical protein